MLIATGEYEPHLPIERERKLVPKIPYFFDGLREQTYPIEQIYLSSPEEPFSLRVRKIGASAYTATLKTRSGQPGGPLQRIEVETPISAETFSFYASDESLPRLRKLRADIVPGVTADFFPGAFTPLIEVEEGHPEAAAFFRDWQEQLNDISDSPEADNERIAFAMSGVEGTPLPPQLEALSIAEEVISRLPDDDTPLVIGIRGRSGSGKTTLSQDVARLLTPALGHVPVISTDDYHRGKQWLLREYGVSEWTNWDHPVVYNTKALAFDLQRYLHHGDSLPCRRFNFTTEEPELLPDDIPPAPVVIVEGLFPHSPDLAEVVDHVYEVQTPVATSIGRRIMRDVGNRLNGSLGSAADILRYQLEIAEPAYRKNS